mgnify:CR=1 FL=1
MHENVRMEKSVWKNPHDAFCSSFGIRPENKENLSQTVISAGTGRNTIACGATRLGAMRPLCHTPVWQPIDRPILSWIIGIRSCFESTMLRIRHTVDQSCYGSNFCCIQAYAELWSRRSITPSSILRRTVSWSNYYRGSAFSLIRVPWSGLHCWLWIRFWSWKRKQSCVSGRPRKSIRQNALYCILSICSSLW